MPELVQFLEFENNGLVCTDIPNNMLGTDFLSTGMENSELFGCRTFQLIVSCKQIFFFKIHAYSRSRLWYNVILHVQKKKEE